jgi:hypothetical protein
MRNAIEEVLAKGPLPMVRAGLAIAALLIKATSRPTARSAPAAILNVIECPPGVAA